MGIGESGSGGMPAERPATPYGGREQTKGVEAAADNRVLMADLKQLDAGLGNRFLTRIPTVSGEVVFFNTPFPTNNPRDVNVSYSAVGVHPETGPIFITPGPLGWELRARIDGKSPAKSVEGNTWEELVENAEKRGAALAPDNRQRKSEVVAVDEPSYPVWERALNEANAEAEREKEREEMMKRVLPKAASAVRRLLQENVTRGKSVVNTQGLVSETPNAVAPMPQGSVVEHMARRPDMQTEPINPPGPPIPPAQGQ